MKSNNKKHLLDINFLRKKKSLKIFKEFIEIMNSVKFKKYFISGGSLLGIVRENSFLKFDTDIDFETLSDEIRIHRSSLTKIFKKKGFVVIPKSHNELYPKLNFYKQGCKISLGSFEIKNIFWAVSRINIIPLSFFNKIKKIKFMNIYVNAPRYPEKYLEFIYRDWKKEDRSGYFYNLKYYRHDTIHSLIYKIRRTLHLIRD
jgi:phosphorylcholine metabolism protein LicD